MENNRTIYFFQKQNGHIKIGMSKDPKARITSVGYKIKEILQCVYTYKSKTIPASRIESLIHSILEPYALGGEWFDITIEQGKEAVSLAVKHIKKVGHEKIPVWVRVSEELHLACIERAKLEGITVTEFIRRCIYSCMDYDVSIPVLGKINGNDRDDWLKGKIK